MDEQTTFPLPRELSRALTRAAKERGVPKSHLVREALERFLHPEPPGTGARTVREGGAAFIGSLRLGSSAKGVSPG